MCTSVIYFSHLLSSSWIFIFHSGGGDEWCPRDKLLTICIMTQDCCCFVRYFTSMWSFAQLRGLETPSICAFGMDPHTLIIVSADGSFMTAKFSESGEMVSE